MKRYNTLFLCTGNSARSIMAEAILHKIGGDRFNALSAGSHPKGSVHPLALRVLEEYRHDVTGMRSKGWDELARPGAPPLDFVFTVCDSAAGETCPVWPGKPVSAHWGVEDPAAFKGPEDAQLALFRRVYAQLDRRIRLLVVLPLGSLDRLSLQQELDTIGKGGTADRGPR
jgi:protein-tyrosine-phosphatase